MKLRGPIFLSVIGLLLLATTYLPQSTGTDSKEAFILQAIVSGLSNYHYNPVRIDNDFSEKVFDLYIDNMDGSRRFFTQQDMQKLRDYREKLDDEIAVGSLEMFELVQQLHSQALEKTQVYYRELLSQPFDFSKSEEVAFGEDRPFAKDDAELREYWRKSLKYEVLTRYTENLAKQAEAKKAGTDTSAATTTEEGFNEGRLIDKTEADLEAEARQDVLEMFDRFYERRTKLKREEHLSAYLNTITNVYDPHTGYFQPIDKQNFDIRLSGKLEGIGARLMTDGDYTKVSDVVVGGPAWKGKELEENDVIMKVGQGDAEPVDIKGMTLDEVVSQVRGDKGTEVRLTVKKVDGSTKIISIVRDLVILEESFAKSLLLDGPTQGEKIGYVYLPGFYADFQNRGGRYCAADVEEEMNKLRAGGAKGIILDLRNNGGGSLSEVVKMSGLFIEKGPIVQVKDRQRKPDVQVDVDNRVQYDGPVIVMVNQYSASASEILAGALQDYGRAVIVGSKSTFGKGTVQRFIDLDRTISGHEEVKPLGEIKLTIQKFYRITGGSNQLKGVIPDIVLPDSYHYIETGEKEEKYPLEWSEIEKVDFNQNVYQVKGMLGELKRRSSKRIAENATFDRVLENARRLERQRKVEEYPLAITDYRRMKDELEAEAKQYENIFESVVVPGVTNLEVDLKSIHADEGRRARNDEFVKSVSKDVYIQESLHIMHDMLTLNK